MTDDPGNRHSIETTTEDPDVIPGDRDPTIEITVQHHNEELPSEDTLNAVRQEATGARESSQEAESPPTPAPRRSERSRKLPVRFDSFQMNQMVTRPYDCKLQALETLMSSGVLNQVDAEVASRMIMNVMGE